MKKNLIYNLAYQLLIVILPFITVPYVSRIIGVNGIGINSYTYSVTAYFMLFALLGINNYGNRTIAKVKDNKEKLSKSFINIYSLQIIMSILMITLYVLYIIFFDVKYKTIAYLQIMYLISTALDVNWLFFGLEKFKITVTRNTIIKIVSLIMIFLFIKDSGDLHLYILILDSSQLISNLLLCPFVIKEIKFEKPNLNEIKKHFKPSLVLFVPVIAVSLYKVMDKIMLGALTSVIEVGYYEQAEKIISMPMTFIAAVGTVMMPRMSNLIANGKIEENKKYINKAINLIMFVTIPMVFGLMAVAENFVPLFLGEDFTKSGILVIFLAPTLLFLSWANVIRTQYLIPNEKDKTYIVSVISGAIVNLILNFMLISKYHSIGAVIGTIVAEFTVMIIQTIAVRKELDIIKYLKDIVYYFLTGLVMFIIVCCLSEVTQNQIYNLTIQIVIGGIIYLTLNIKTILNLLQKK